MPITINTPCKPGEKTPSVTYSQRRFQPPVYTPSKNTGSSGHLSSQSSLESSLPSSFEELRRRGGSHNTPTPSPQSIGTPPTVPQDLNEDIVDELVDELDDLHYGVRSLRRLFQNAAQNLAAEMMTTTT
ncbi:uncharacterized protein LOC62_07G009054 [Vanrija pseudolonga]|uniref:Uncharacterized protein n=1 Tax=Vanrija pseudolonga TaxID=143232 RepID=A0AAF0YJ14_9TREE|nr:hypothetical protein LOC62_07G009054 [Vanrija pseudolonga]